VTPLAELLGIETISPIGARPDGTSGGEVGKASDGVGIIPDLTTLALAMEERVRTGPGVKIKRNEIMSLLDSLSRFLSDLSLLNLDST
jgi:hypothetical protein